MTKNNLFHAEHRILADQCAIGAKDKQNNTISDYSTYNYFKGNENNCSHYNKDSIIETSIDTQMHIRDGYGVANMCVIDNDSKIRNDSKITHYKDNIQLFTRVFQGIPNINKGGLVIPIEDRVKQGEFNSMRKGCDRVSETQFPVFVPLVPCISQVMQNADTVVPNFELYKGTRDLIQQQKFLETNGYYNDNGVWTKKICSFADR